eukprot:COSAG01_NODE_2460_length_7655_cov_15.411858_1_plen_56_part_10
MGVLAPKWHIYYPGHSYYRDLCEDPRLHDGSRAINSPSRRLLGARGRARRAAAAAA